MTWRTIVLTKECKLSLRMNQLVIKSDDIVTVPLSEIGQLIIENPNIVLTGHIINALSEHKVMTLICNERHLPHSHINLIYGHFRQAQMIKQQLNWQKERKSVLWQKIVQHKIMNQQHVLHYYYPELEENILEKYAKDVQRGDRTNREGHAAKVYFNNMFGLGFIRGSDTPINWALNYGYSVLLALFTRTITVKGLLTEVGIHHENQFNFYNLASDFMEVYRPLIDHIVRGNIVDEFGKEEKWLLLDIFNQKILIKNKRQYVANSVEIFLDGLIDYLESGNETYLAFPSFLFDDESK